MITSSCALLFLKIKCKRNLFPIAVDGILKIILTFTMPPNAITNFQARDAAVPEYDATCTVQLQTEKTRGTLEVSSLNTINIEYEMPYDDSCWKV